MSRERVALAHGEFGRTHGFDYVVRHPRPAHAPERTGEPTGDRAVTAGKKSAEYVLGTVNQGERGARLATFPLFRSDHTAARTRVSSPGGL